MALDLSSNTGWAFGFLTDHAPRFGTWHLTRTSEGARYASFENELIAMIEHLRPARIVLEASLSFEALLGVSTMKVMRQQLTLRGMAFAEAWRAAIPISEVGAETVRLALLGKSRFPKGTVKAEVMRFCHAQGWRVPDDNAGDACLIWAWSVGQTQDRTKTATPLFQGDLVQ